MKIYLLRHGETDANFKKIALGKNQDRDLNEKGITQSEEFLKNMEKDLDIIISSPLKRALETAEIIAKELKIPIVTNENLVEPDSGSLGGKTWDKIAKITKQEAHPEVLAKEPEYDFSPYGGETKEQVRDRIQKAIQKIKTDYGNKKVLVVTHGGVIRILHAIYQRPIPKKIKNLSLHEFEI